MMLPSRVCGYDEQEVQDSSPAPLRFPNWRSWMSLEGLYDRQNPLSPRRQRSRELVDEAPVVGRGGVEAVAGEGEPGRSGTADAAGGGGPGPRRPGGGPARPRGGRN